MEQPLTGLMTPMVWLYLAFGCVALLALVAAFVLVVMALRRRPDPALDGLVSQADIVRGQVEAGQLQPSQAQPLVAQDRRGQHWGLDPLEGGWQTWDGTEWQPAQPPRKRRRWPLLVTALVLGLVALCVLPAMGLWMLSEGTVEVPTLMPVCTPPACGPDEVYYCAGECPGGCGTTCATPTPAGGSTGPVTAMPRCTPPPCGPDEVYYCAEPCPGGCGTTCVTPTPSPAPSEAGEATPMVMCTPPLCGAGEVYHCPGECPGGCGTTCETPTPTAEPEKPPTVTPGSEAAARPTLTPVGGSGTPVPPATGCETEAWGWFEGALQMVAGVREGLGCPTEDAVDLAAASQDFQHGYMVWRADEDMIYVFHDGGGWEAYRDNWEEGMDEQDPAFGPPPEGLIQPKRGFGLVWQEYPTVRDRMGWGLNAERPCDGAHGQRFERGVMIECTQDVVPRARIQVFILNFDHTYTLYSPP